MVMCSPGARGRAWRGRGWAEMAGIVTDVRRPELEKTSTAATMRAAPARFLRQGRRGGHGGAPCGLRFARGLLNRRRRARRPWRLGFELVGEERARENGEDKVGDGVGMASWACSSLLQVGAARSPASSWCGASDELGRYRMKTMLVWFIRYGFRNFPVLAPDEIRVQVRMIPDLLPDSLSSWNFLDDSKMSK